MKLTLTLFLSYFTYVFAAGQIADEPLIQNYIATSDSLGNLSDFKNAITYRKKALNLLQIQTPVPHEILASTYRNIGFYYRKWGKYSESKKYQSKALSLAVINLPPKHPEIAKSQNGLGAYYFALQDYENALKHFEDALQIGLLNDSPDIGDYYNNIGISLQGLGRNEEALSTYKKALQYNLKTNGLYNTNSADNYENLGTLLFSLNQFDQALMHLDTTEMVLDSLLEPGSPYFASVYNNKGVVHNAKGDSRNAYNYFSNSLKIYEDHGLGNHPEIANIYANLGLLLQEKGDLDAALLYFNRALEIRSSNFGEVNSKVARTYLYLGSCYLDKSYFNDAFKALNKSLELLNKLGAKGLDIIDSRNGIGAYFEKIKNLNEALDQYQQALNLCKIHLEPNDPVLASTLARISKVLIEKEDYSNAIPNLQHALKIQQKVYGENHPEIAETYRLLAIACGSDHNCRNSYIEKAMISIGYNKLANSKSFELVTSSIQLLNIFLTWSRGLYQDYETNGKLESLEKANQISESSISLINHIKTNLEQPGSRLALLDNYYLVFENAILIKYQLYQETGSISYLHGAHYISEQSNAILLNESIRAVEAEQFTGIPDSIIQLERQIKTELSFEEKKLYEEKLKSTESNGRELVKIKNRIFQLQNQQRQLISFIKENYKDYFNLKYDQKEIEISTIQNTLLRQDQTMISYFVGESNLFVFVIAKNDLNLVKIGKDFPLEIWVEEFRTSIYSFNPADSNTAYLNQKLANLGHELYQIVFEPIRSLIKTESLLIVPGGVLGYLPFDALLQSPADSYNEFDSFNYLINNYNISYCYSSTLLADMNRGHHRKRPFVAFAPVYYGDTLNVNRSDDPWRAVLGQLRFNVQEAKRIHELMGGEIYLDSLATESMFLLKATQAGIIHLATHGKSDDRNGEYSYLAFYQTQDNIENELLFVKNLYNMKIPASMVVLSACETGIGELQRGEGIVSLARGFSFAGAASIVTTLWSIDDNASANIMVDFYKNLLKGQTKDIALRNAKVNYIQSNLGNNRTHPLFWAAFVPVGNMEPINPGFPWWSIVAVFVVICGILLFLKYKKNPKS